MRRDLKRHRAAAVTSQQPAPYFFHQGDLGSVGPPARPVARRSPTLACSGPDPLAGEIDIVEHRNP